MRRCNQVLLVVLAFECLLLGASAEPRPFDRQHSNGRFVQDWRRDHNFVFGQIHGAIPAYVRVSHLKTWKGHHSYSVQGATLCYSKGARRYYGAQLPLHGSHLIQVTEYLLPKKKPGEEKLNIKRRWPSIVVGDPEPLFINRAGNQLPPGQKVNPGLFMGVNNNDDDQDGIPDLSDDDVPGESSMIAVNLVRPKGMPVELSWDDSIVHLYETPRKAFVSSNETHSARIGGGGNTHAYKGYDDQVIYVEGVAPGSTEITLTGPGGLVDKLRVSVIGLDIAMDGNRDDAIDFSNPEDGSYLFWVNNDHDERHYLQTETIWVEDDRKGEPDCENDYIGFDSRPNSSSCKRDLEDFARLHIRVDDTTRSLPGIGFFLSYESETNNPAINIFEAVNESSAYLRDVNIANSQILKKRLLVVDATERQLPLKYIKSNDRVSPFLIEGRQGGIGKLTLTIRCDDLVLCRKSIQLTLHNAAWFYDKYTVSATGDRWESVVSKTASHQQPSSGYTPATQENFLLIHGWNMTDDEKVQWVETTFKRLWWQGYQGAVALFSWPTLADFDFWDVLSGGRHFDNSEFRSWQSAEALVGVINKLNKTGSLRIMAHSMGNVVAGEAIRKYEGLPIHTYIACQAAISGHYYDESLPSLLKPKCTPNVIRNFHNGIDAMPYLYSNSKKVMRSFNYYNELDWALDHWVNNNWLKPDNVIPYYFWYYGRIDQYDEAVDSFVRGMVGHTKYSIHNDDDLHKIFSYIVESRSRALGQQAVDHKLFSCWNLEQDLLYDDEHYSHSKQFRSSIPEQWSFWNRVRRDARLLTKKKP